MLFKKMLKTPSLTSRLILTYLAGLLILGAGIYSYLFIFNPNFLIDFIMTKQFNHISHNLYENAQGKLVFTTYGEEKVWIYKELSDDVYFQVLDPKGNIAIQSTEHGPDLSTKLPIPSVSRGLFHFNAYSDDKKMRVLAGPLGAPLSGYTLEVALSARLLDVMELANIRPISRIAFITIGLSVLLVSLVVLITIRRMVKPLWDLSIQSAAISPSNLQARLVTTAIPCELIPLVSAFNATLDRLENGFKVQQELLATAAHELKTPLALIRGEIEMSESLENKELVLQDVDHLARQIHQILHFAEARELQNYQFKPVDPAQTLDDVIGFLSRLAQKKSIQLISNMSTRHRALHADASMLFTLVKNLLENAIIHSPVHASIEIELNEDALTIRDFGSGIQEEYLPHVFKKFWRAPARQIQGAGLGLSICYEIAEAHQWQISVENASPGARFHLAFRSDL